MSARQLWALRWGLPAAILAAIGIRHERKTRRPVTWKSPGYREPSRVATVPEPVPSPPTHDEWVAALRSADQNEWDEMERNALAGL